MATQAVDIGVQGRLGRRIGRHGDCGHKGEEAAGEDQGGGKRLLQQMGEELGRQIDEPGKVDVHLGVEGIQVELCGPREPNLALDARVEKDAVEVGVPAHDAGPCQSHSKAESWMKPHLPLNKDIQAGPVGDIVLDTAGLFGAVFLDKGVQSVLTTADGDDLAALEDELVGQCRPDSRGGADQEDALVGEGHVCVGLQFRVTSKVTDRSGYSVQDTDRGDWSYPSSQLQATVTTPPVACGDRGVPDIKSA